MKRVLAAGLMLLGLVLVACDGTGPGGSATASSSAAAPASPSVAAPPASTVPPRPAPPPSLPAPAAPKPALAVPVAVIVENAPGARPQSGLDQADLVWEVLAEGFITRFFAVFSSRAAAQIGPVRSTRIYFDHLDQAYRLPLAHAGGNSDALYALAPDHIEDLDEIYNSGGYFWRSTDRQAPHNLYTSTDLLEQAAAHRDYAARPVLDPPTGPLPAPAQPTASVTLTYYNNPKLYTYIAGWIWQDGAWVRQVNGQTQVMTDGHQVRAGTVLILVIPTKPDPHAPETVGALDLIWSAGGTAWVLRDGRRTQGSWALGQNGLPALSAGGQPLAAGAGPYWYEVVPSASDVTFG